MDLCRKQTKNKDNIKKLANVYIKLLKESFSKNIISVKDQSTDSIKQVELQRVVFRTRAAL